MERILIVKRDIGYYYAKDHTNSEMYVLGNYLTNDVYDSNSWKKWILDDNQIETCSNFSYQDKEDDGRILIGFLHSDDFQPSILVKKEQLLGLLDAWDNYIKQGASTFIIYKEGDNIHWEIVPQRGKVVTLFLSVRSRIKQWIYC